MKDFVGKSGSKHIILVTDRKKTFGGNITLVAEQLKKAGIIVHVVAYKITPKEKASITPLYVITGGQYFEASGQEGLQVVFSFYA